MKEGRPTMKLKRKSREFVMRELGSPKSDRFYNSIEQNSVKT